MLLFATAILLVIGIFLIKSGIDNEVFGRQLIGFILITVSLFSLIAISYTIFVSNTKPQAIDVYRGNTTLQITYQDSIPVDSIVVFKNKSNESKNLKDR